MKKMFHYVILFAVVFTSCDKTGDEFPSHPKQDSKMISDWIGLHLQLIRKTTGVTHIAYSRHFGYTGIAVYESLVKGFPQYKSIAASLNGNVNIPVFAKGNELFYPASANAAMATMLRFFYSGNPANVVSIDSLEKLYQDKFVSVVPKKYDLSASIEFGKQVANVVIDWSKLDGAANANIPYTLMGEGYWEPTPNNFASANVPGWGNNKSLLPGSINGTMPPAPTTFSKEAGTPFYNMVKEVYDYSKNATQEQKNIAWFWDDAPNGTYVTVFGHWFSILKQTLDKEKTPLMKGAEAYLRLGVTMNEAAISCWKSKYTYHQIRPVSYVRKYMGDAGWSPLIATPPHPEYSAAHPTLSASAGYALESVFRKNYSFTDHTYDLNGMGPRSFSSFEEAAREAGMSRVYGGIHYRPSVETGNWQGKKIGTNVWHLLKTH